MVPLSIRVKPKAPTMIHMAPDDGLLAMSVTLINMTFHSFMKEWMNEWMNGSSLSPTLPLCLGTQGNPFIYPLCVYGVSTSIISAFTEPSFRPFQDWGPCVSLNKQSFSFGSCFPLHLFGKFQSTQQHQAIMLVWLIFHPGKGIICRKWCSLPTLASKQNNKMTMVKSVTMVMEMRKSLPWNRAFL